MPNILQQIDKGLQRLAQEKNDRSYIDVELLKIKEELTQVFLDAIQNVQINVPEIKIPDINVPEIATPVIPEIKIPDIAIPEANIKVEIPDIKVPNINVPEAKVTVKVPEIKTDGIEKVITKAFKSLKLPIPEVTVNAPETKPEEKIPLYNGGSVRYTADPIGEVWTMTMDGDPVAEITLTYFDDDKEDLKTFNIKKL